MTTKTRTKNALESEKKYFNAIAKREERKWLYVVNKARKYMRNIYEDMRRPALKKIMRLTHLNRSEKMKLSYSQEYVGLHLEEVKIESADITRAELIERVSQFGDACMVDDWMREAENSFPMPKTPKDLLDLCKSEDTLTLDQISTPRKSSAATDDMKKKKLKQLIV